MRVGDGESNVIASKQSPKDPSNDANACSPHHSVAPDHNNTLVLAIELSNKSWVLAAQVPGLARVKAKQTIEPTVEAASSASGLPGAGKGCRPAC